MPTNRTPIRRVGKTKITPRAIAIFRAMQEVECYGDDWWKLHKLLSRELITPPLQFPCVERPGTTFTNPKSDPEAVRLYCELERAITLS